MLKRIEPRPNYSIFYFKIFDYTDKSDIELGSQPGKRLIV